LDASENRCFSAAKARSSARKTSRVPNNPDVRKREKLQKIYRGEAAGQWAFAA
jgi:hypothetical protein